MKNEVHTVEVIDANTDEVVKVIETANKRTAERVEDGLNINLNHMRYFTRIVEPKQ